MIEALLIGGVAFVLALIAGRPVVRLLRSFNVGKAISEDGPSSHLVKAGTPTMGGLLIWGTVDGIGLELRRQVTGEVAGRRTELPLQALEAAHVEQRHGITATLFGAGAERLVGNVGKGLAVQEPAFGVPVGVLEGGADSQAGGTERHEDAAAVQRQISAEKRHLGRLVTRPFDAHVDRTEAALALGR